MKRTTAEKDPNATAHLHELIADISVAMVTTVTPDGALRSRPMFTQDIHGEGELWFFTADDTEKTRDLAGEQGVNVSYADPVRGRYVSVTGNANVVHDSNKLQELWHSGMERYFPKGRDDPHLALIRVRIETAEFWDATTNKMMPLPGSAAEPAGEPTQVDIRATRASG